MHRRQEGRGLTAVLFTDIVGSTDVATDVGDARWRTLLPRHFALSRELVKRSGGHIEDTTGDGIFATFARPIDAIRCACALARAVRGVGLEIRAGVHFGEVERVDGKVAGIGVHTGARVMSAASAGEVLVTASTRELVAGGGVTFSDRGGQHLKGLDAPVHLFAVDSVDGEQLEPPLDAEEARDRRDAVSLPRARRGRWVAAAVPVAVVAVTVGVVFARNAGGDRPTPARGGPVLVRLGPQTHRVASVVARLHSVESTCGTFDPTIAVGAGKVWGGWDPGLISIDPGTGAESTTTSVPRSNSCSFGLSDDRGWRVWLLRDSTLMQIDPNDGKVVAQRVIGPLKVGIPHTDLAIGGGSLWAGGQSTIVRIDPGATLDEAPYKIPFVVDALRYADGALFVLDGFGGRIYRLDPTTMKPIAQGSVNVTLPVMRVGGGYVWVLDQSNGTIQKFVENDLSPLGQYTTTDSDTSDLAFGFGAAWVSSINGRLYRIDASTGDRTSIVVGTPIDAIAVDSTFESSGALWLAAERPPTIPT